jgi:uncharacterized membrane protein
VRLDAPEWLLLLPALAFVAWYWRGPRLYRPLRALALLLAVLALARPRLVGKSDGLDLWVLADRSASARDLLVPRLSEIETLLERSRSRDDRLFFVDFAEEASLRGSEGALASAGEASRIASALRFTLGSADPRRTTRVLLLTDGYSTEPLDGIGERLDRENVPLDLRFVVSPERNDFAVERIDVPMRAKPLEPFTLEVRFRGDENRSVPFALFRNGARQTTGVVAIEDGRGVARFTDRLPAGSGATRYEVRLDGKDDFPGNDRAQAWVEIDGGPRIVLVTAYAGDPLASVLSRQGLRVQVVTDPRSLTVGSLSGARTLIMNNVPATHLPRELLDAVDFWVRVQGGGFLMAGGETSFGAGGYFQSPLDPLLPVSMELREEHRMLSVSMAIVMDRSGSMSVGVEGGRTKMDLANEGAARSIELLGPADSVAVFAVDSSAHTVVPLTTLSGGSGPIVDKVRRVNSMGGGIFVYEGLSAAWKELETSRSGQRHVILFADAADSEEPGDYKNLLARMVREDTTVSVIGLGTPEDVDAKLLEEIATLGKGRVFFNADPATLPALFAQETVAVARSAFLDEPVGVEKAQGFLEIARGSTGTLQGLDTVDGYNLSYLRKDATAAAYSKDEYEAPLVAFWNRGAGRVAAVSFPLGGAYSRRVRAWSGYGDFAQTLSRWLMGEDVPPGTALETRLDGTTLKLDLFFDETWEETLSRTPAEVFLARSGADAIEDVLWERLEPGRFHAERELRSGEVYRGAVRIGGASLPFGPIAAPGGAEWDFDRERLAELRAISARSGGVERDELASVWRDRVPGSDLELRRALVWSFLLVFLIEALVSRVGWALPRFEAFELPVRAPKATPAPAPAPVVEEVPVPAEESSADRRRERFARAKRGN